MAICPRHQPIATLIGEGSGRGKVRNDVTSARRPCVGETSVTSPIGCDDRRRRHHRMGALPGRLRLRFGCRIGLRCVRHLRHRPIVGRARRSGCQGGCLSHPRLMGEVPPSAPTGGVEAGKRKVRRCCGYPWFGPKLHRMIRIFFRINLTAGLTQRRFFCVGSRFVRWRGTAPAIAHRRGLLARSHRRRRSQCRGSPRDRPASVPPPRFVRRSRS